MVLTITSGARAQPLRRRGPGRRPHLGPRPQLRRFRGVRRRAIERFRQRGGPFAVDEAREAVRRGDVQPLFRVFEKIGRRPNTEILDVDLFQRPGGWVYALRVLGPRGRVRDVTLNAKTLDVMSLD